MNNYHIYEEIGRGKYSVVYKVPFSFFIELKHEFAFFCKGKKKENN